MVLKGGAAMGVISRERGNTSARWALLEESENPYLLPRSAPLLLTLQNERSWNDEPGEKEPGMVGSFSQGKRNAGKPHIYHTPPGGKTLQKIGPCW